MTARLRGRVPPGLPDRRRTALLALLAALLVGLFLAFQRLTPTRLTSESVEVKFVQDMIQHHQQATVMAKAIRARSTQRTIRSLALDIELSQGEQIRQMQGWLRVWRFPAGAPMPADHARMMGMASPAELQSLNTLPIPQAEREFLRLMTRHHQGALMMVEDVLQDGKHPEVLRLARQIAVTQQGEIQTMRQIGLRLGEVAPPEPMPMHQH